MKLAIILGYYNGSMFIKEQLDSIDCAIRKANTLNQTEIHIFDDFSSAKEFEYLSNLKTHTKMFIHRGTKNFGVIKNFSKGLTEVDADWYFLSDQDDVWFEEKISVFLEKITSTDPKIPTLIFSDLEVVDENLNVMSSRMHSLDQNFTNVPWLFFRNVVTGCAMAINKPLRDFSTPIPDKIPMHDHWITNVANVMGDIYFIPEPLVKYRQHGRNVLGATKKGIAGIIQKTNIEDRKRSALNFTKLLAQLDIVSRKYNSDLAFKISKSASKGSFKGLWELKRLGALPPGFLAKVSFIINFFFHKE